MLADLLENARRKSHGMASFYRNLLEEEEGKHEAAVLAASKATKIGKGTETVEEDMEVEITREKKLADEARRLNAQLGTEAVLLNDEGEVVDKRQLLKSGLNILPSKKSTSAQTAGTSEYQSEYEVRRNWNRDKILREREARERQRKVIEEQYERSKKRGVDEEWRREEELRMRVKSKKSENEVLGARERYLARKQAAIKEL